MQFALIYKTLHLAALGSQFRLGSTVGAIGSVVVSSTVVQSIVSIVGSGTVIAIGSVVAVVPLPH